MLGAPETVMQDARICQAISKKLVLQISYNNKVRLIEPHAYGVDALGNDLLNGWQQTPQPVWRSFRLHRVTLISTTPAHFERPRPEYKRNDKTLSRIYCQV